MEEKKYENILSSCKYRKYICILLLLVNRTRRKNANRQVIQCKTKLYHVVLYTVYYMMTILVYVLTPNAEQTLLVAQCISRLLNYRLKEKVAFEHVPLPLIYNINAIYIFGG